MASLAHVVAPLRRARPDLRWAPPEAWHLTLAFLGEVPSAGQAVVSRRLAGPAARHAPVRLVCAGAGTFGPARAARVLWVGLDGERDRLGALARSVAAAARRAGVEVEPRPFRPHLTLARAARPLPVEDLLAALAGYAGPPWTADRLHLVRSHPPPGAGRPPRYETVRTWPLGTLDADPGSG